MLYHLFFNNRDTHYDKRLKKKVKTINRIEDDTPAWLMIDLVKSLKEWLGQSCRVSYEKGETFFRLGYAARYVPVLEFAQLFAPLICKVNTIWPVQIFGMSYNHDLVEISFAASDDGYIVMEQNISRIWCDDLQDIYFNIQFPDVLSASCMHRIIWALICDEQVVVFDWKFSDFLNQQNLFKVDYTLSYCYVSLTSESVQENPVACLSGLQLQHKEILWRLFLEKHLASREFEWVKNTLLQENVPNWIEWHLALYRTLKQIGIKLVDAGSRFELVDNAGKHLYFSLEHANAAEYVLMKILFPFNK